MQQYSAQLDFNRQNFWLVLRLIILSCVNNTYKEPRCHMNTKTKTIKMLLYDGSLNGVINISDSAWGSGKMYSAPRELIKKLTSYADCKKYGVYLLLSDRQVYVGQAVDLERRTRQHLTDKDWWTQVILMTTKDDSLTATDIDYLESRLIELAGKAYTFDSDNRKRGNPQKVDEFRCAELEQFLDEALFLLDLIGVSVFKKETIKSSSQISQSVSLKPPAPFSSIKSNRAAEKPPLPDKELPPGVFAKEVLTRLLAAGYVFSKEQIAEFSSAEESRKYTKRNLPLFLTLKHGESRATCENGIRKRYWKEEFTSGEYHFLMYSQWYDDARKGATKDDLIRWYEAL